MTLKVKWWDGGREPQCEPDPRYPNGMDVPAPREPYCAAPLPYPAKRCGVYVVTCDACGMRVAVTTAGRVDDPRSIQVPCRGR